jgi:hypothetical protein
LSLYEILQWAAANGEVNVVARIRLKILPLTVKEGIVLDRVKPETTVSPEYLQAVRDVVSQVVGRPCP